MTESSTTANKTSSIAAAEMAYQAGDVRAAIDLYHREIDSGDKSPGTCQTLGELYLHEKEWSPALTWLDRAWHAEPTPLRLERRIMTLTGAGRLGEAYACVAESVEALDQASWKQMPLAEAVYHTCGPNVDDSSPATHDSLQILGLWLFDQQQWDAAISIYQRLIEADDATGAAGAHARLAHIYRFTGRLSAARWHLQRALELDPRNETYRAAWANVLMVTGDIDTGVQTLRQAAEQARDNAEIFSSYLFNAHYSPNVDARALFAAHCRWGRQFATPSLARSVETRDTDPDRPLRIGYLGADFRRHSVGYTLEGILAGHARPGFAIYGYGSVARPDEVTARFRRLCDVYRDVSSLDDARAAELIRNDRLDILVAVAGHSYGHRLRVLAYRPAPIQVDYGGINTTGMAQVDYRLTDERRDPPDLQERFLETLVYLPEGSTCYQPPQATPEVGPLPLDRNGAVTFGACHGAQKLNPPLLALWGQVLQTVPETRLIIKCPGGQDADVQERLLRPLLQTHISRERVSVEGLRSEGDHLAFYHQIDIALDAYPFNGGVSTLEACWMGVPPVTLTGPLTVSRTGLTILTQLEMGGLAAATPQQYIQTAAALAANPTALGRIRSTLRNRMRAGSLCDTKRYVRQLEQAYRLMWTRYCNDLCSEVLRP